MPKLNIVETLENTLKSKRKQLSEFQMTHLTTTIKFLKDMKKDFVGARKDYENEMRKHR